MVTLTLRVLSRPEISRVSQIYRSLGLDYDERVLPSIGNEVLKATVAQFDGALGDDWVHLLLWPADFSRSRRYDN